MGKIEIVTGDITRLSIDAVVNAANNALLGGMGVDGAIHRAGGPAILQACQALRERDYPDGLPTGEAVATTAGLLPAKWVIHTVGPVYDRDPDPAGQLAACYRNSLYCAQEVGAQSIAFPSISTGVYGYPKAAAAQIAIQTLRTTEIPMARRVLVAFSEADAQILQQILASLTSHTT
ncbi:O-acetyl-ADP-ribose deacetylase [Magnetococcus sp. PR-3]|uniref:O-acetyl-ADP-ribose deacetylase n=1 Tax=Magnetococcus sp. PR-3 TaxID=3120355 RepID=UPI002FCE501B